MEHQSNKFNSIGTNSTTILRLYNEMHYTNGAIPLVPIIPLVPMDE